MNNTKPNSLINEDSPYLKQHAYNPVNWYAWNEDAFKLAKVQDKPIFLSIGYSTCHWCHVMEKESFEDLEIAKILNDNFIAIKVDKESRPDIDAVYMEVCQAFTGNGGWPTTIIMNPNKIPFFAGTYFPKSTTHFSLGLTDILNKISYMWKNDKEKLTEIGYKALQTLSIDQIKAPQNSASSDKILSDGINIFKKFFDKINGGFGGAPKFPSPHNLMFLLRVFKTKGDKECLKITQKTLQQMYRRGIFNHIGYGFSRYSTDEMWLVPHFEKMLYDNALLTIIYLETYVVTQNSFYKMVAEKIIEYLSKEVQDTDGGFYSAQDADSNGEEGKFYTFSYDEIINLLGNEDGLYFNKWFNVRKIGNFEGKNILNLINNLNYKEENERINNLIKKLYNYRLKREDLHLDIKILTSWNALAAIALIKAYKFLLKDEYLKLAVKTLNFIENKLVNDKTEIFIENINGSSKGKGVFNDYAFLLWTYIEFYETTFDTEYLEKALKMYYKILPLFYDESNGGFYLYSSTSEKLILRPKEIYDGAMPSGNSVVTYSLIKLYRFTGDIKINYILEKQLEYMLKSMVNPMGHSFFLMSLLLMLYPGDNLICTLNDDEQINELKKINQKIIDNIYITVKSRKNNNSINDIMPFMKNYSLKSTPMYYLCRDFKCKKPVDNIKDLDMDF